MEGLKLLGCAKKCYGNTRNIEISLWWWPWRRFTSGSSDSVMLVNRLKKRRNRVSFKIENPKKMLKN